jgi:hypothetical protein
VTCSLVEGCPRPDTSGGGCVPHKFEGGIRVKGMALFKHDRDLGLTQMGKAREQETEARADGRDIMRVRGRKATTETYRNGSWEKN